MWEKHSRRSSAVALVVAMAIFAGLSASGLKAEAQDEPALISAGGLRILVVESHDQTVSVDAGRAAEINADNPEYRLLRFDAVDASAQVDRLTASVASISVDLSAYDIVVIPCPSGAGLSPQESDAVTTFLDGGGGLLLMGNSGCGRDFGTLGNKLGFDFEPTVVVASAYLHDPESFWLPEVVPHQITAWGEGIQVNWGGSFTFDENWQVLARTGADSWIDSERNRKRDADEPGGPFDSLAVRDFGEGRVVAIADDLAFHVYPYRWKIPAKVAGSILAWLADANMFTVPPAGGRTQGLAGTTSMQALINAQAFEVQSVWKLDVATQRFRSYIPGAPSFANTLAELAATDIVTLKSK